MRTSDSADELATMHALAAPGTPNFDVARQLLLRRPEDWDGSAARRLVMLALSRSGARLTDHSFRSLVAAAFRVGREIDSAGCLRHEVPWPMEELRGAIRDAMPPGPEEEARERLAHNLASKLKGFEPDRPILKDWVELVTRAVRQEDADGPSLDLGWKLVVARALESQYSGWLDRLVRRAEELLEVTLEDVCESLVRVLATRASASATAVAEQESGARQDERLHERDVRRLGALASAPLQADFESWIVHLSPVAQAAVHRRLVGLAEGSPLRRMWIKPILGNACSGLKELRVVADGIHYRILFTLEVGGQVRVRAFGFRRDLESMIRIAAGASA